MAIVAPFSGALSDRVGSRAPATLRMLLLTGGLRLLAWMSGIRSGRSDTCGSVVVGLGTRKPSR